MQPIISIILAGGKGTRMGGDMPKACVDFLGRPLIAHAIDAVLPLSPQKIVVVVGYKSELVIEAVQKYFPKAPIEFALQKEQLGTGDAVNAARPHIEGFSGNVLVSYCDVPRLKTDTLEALIRANENSSAGETVLSALVDDPTGYGRVVRGDDGNVTAIVEEKNATEEEKQINEINTGINCFRADDLIYALRHIAPNPVNGEYYLTDAIEILRAKGSRVGAMPVNDFREVLGANTPDELAALAEIS